MTTHIPSFLASLHRYCLWTLRPAPGGKPTKVPDQSTLDLAQCRDWGTIQFEPRTEKHGVGLVFTKGIHTKFTDGTDAQLIGIDLDGCRKADTGEISSWAQEIVVKLGRPYTEVSPSGWGLRIFALVRPEQLKGLRAHGSVPYPAPAGCPKKPDLQLFTEHGYCTVTFQHLVDTSDEITSIDLKWLTETYQFRADGEGKAAALPTGEGDEPTLDEIERIIAKRKHGPELIVGDWEAVMPDKSASDAYFMLEAMALDAARGHGAAAVRFLLQRTAWGRGEIENSRDPGKYTRSKWVAGDVSRIAGKRNGHAPVTMFPTAAVVTKTPAAIIAHSVEQLCTAWETDGPLVHLPTGLPSLDAMTGGGFVLGSRVYILGAPDAWKTGLGVQIIDQYLRMGIPCAILGIDEEPSDLMGRLLQRRGLTRDECEKRTPVTMQRARELLAGLPVLLFGSETTIEQAAEALHQFARSRVPEISRPPCVLLIDSVQVARCKDENYNDTLHKLVSQRVATIRAVATAYRMLTITTSEMNRGAYRSKKSEEQNSDMAAAKESGAIEYSARVQILLRNVPGSSDTVEMRIAKNKHGRGHRVDQAGIYLRTDRDRQTLVEDAEFEPIDMTEEKRVEAENMRRLTDACALCRALIMKGPLGVRAAARETGLRAERLAEVRDWLKELGALTETTGARGSVVMELQAAKLPENIQEQMML